MRLFSEYKGLRREVYVLFFGRIMTNMGALIWPLLTLILSNKLHMSATEIASLTLLFSFVSLPMTLLGGKLADRFNKRNIIIVCDLITIVGYIICGIIPLTIYSIWIMLFASLFQGMEWPAYDSLVADLTTSNDREKAYSLNYLGANLGLVLSPTIGGLLFKNHLNLAFFINAISLACSTLLIFFFIKDVSQSKSSQEETNEYENNATNQNTFSVLRSRKAILLYIMISSIAQIVYNQFDYLIPLNLEMIHGDNGAVLFGSITSLNCIIVVILTPLITKWLRQVKEVNKMTIGQACIIFSLIMYPFIQGMIPFYYISICIFTIGEITNTLANTPFLTKRIPASHRGRILSFVNITCSIVASLFKVFIGTIIDTQGIIHAWIVIGLLGACCILLLFGLKHLDKKEYPKLYSNDTQF